MNYKGLDWSAVGGVFGLAAAIVGLGVWGPYGFDRFLRKEFWTLFAPVLFIGIFGGVFVALMSNDSSAAKDPLSTAVSAFLMVFSASALSGLFPAYFLNKPSAWYFRMAIGLFVVLPLGVVLLELIIQLFIWLAAAFGLRSK